MEHDQLWRVRQGVLAIYLGMDTSEEEDDLEQAVVRAQEAKDKSGVLLGGIVPVVVKLYDHIFGKEILVGMGDRAKCQYMFRQLTDTKGILKGRTSINIGLAIQFTEAHIGLWMRETWMQMRDTAHISGLFHEAMHAVEIVMDLAGMKPHRQNEELRAYYQQWICETVAALCKLNVMDWILMGIDVRSLREEKS